MAMFFFPPFVQRNPVHAELGRHYCDATVAKKNNAAIVFLLVPSGRIHS